MTTQQGGPAGDVTPVPMHLASIEAGLSLGAAPERSCSIRTIAATYVSTAGDGNGPVQILPQTSKKRRAIISAHGAVGGGNPANAFGWLAPNKSDAANQRGAYIQAAGTVPVILHGQDPWWFMADPAATIQLGLTVITEYQD